MKIITRKTELQDILRGVEDASFVPTMGNLHQGHLRLVREAALRGKLVIISIFVNENQFAPNEDFASYPRTFESDLELLRDNFPNHSHQIIVFHPHNYHEVYPENQIITLDSGKLGKVLCGVTRTHFFNGVINVVYQLFQLIKPEVAYFGLKDRQQFLIINKMVKDLLLPVKLVGVETVREESGLALSSRNQYLTESEKMVAPALYQTLLQIKNAYQNNYIPGIEKKFITDLEKSTPFKIDYLATLTADTLENLPPDPPSYGLEVATFVAAKLGKARLIDNISYLISK